MSQALIRSVNKAVIHLFFTLLYLKHPCTGPMEKEANRKSIPHKKKWLLQYIFHFYLIFMVDMPHRAPSFVCDMIAHLNLAQESLWALAEFKRWALNMSGSCVLSVSLSVPCVMQLFESYGHQPINTAAEWRILQQLSAVPWHIDT